MRLTGLFACLPVVAVVVATGCADGPLEGVRPVKYVKIDDANASTTTDPPPKAPSTKRDPALDDKPATATTSAASSSSETMEPDELINAAGSASSGGGKKPSKGGKPPKQVGGSKPTKDGFGGRTPTDDKCYRAGKNCCGDAIAAQPKVKEGTTICPKGTVPGGSCKKKCPTV